MKVNLTWILQRAQERSTYLGITAIASAFGVVISPELLNNIIAIASGISGAILMFTKDKQ